MPRNQRGIAILNPNAMESRTLFAPFSRSDLTVLTALCVIIATVLSATLAPLIAPADPYKQQLTAALRPPSWAWMGPGMHILGTDQLGRDILSRMIYGGRVTLAVAATAVLCSGAIGTAIGIASGYYGGILDDVAMRIADIELSIPFILFAIVFMVVLGTSLPNLIVVLVIQGWVVYARLVRGQVLALREQEFITALRALGGSNARIMTRHVFPNIASAVVVVATLETANMIIIAAGLSFLGLGGNPLTPDWGGMLGDGRDYLTSAWWLATFPGAAITVTVISVNILGDWLRDKLDPRLRA